MVVVSNHSLTFDGRVGVGTSFLAHFGGLDLLVCKLKHTQSGVRVDLLS